MTEHLCKKCGTVLQPGPVVTNWHQMMYCPKNDCGIIQLVKTSEGEITNVKAQQLQEREMLQGKAV